MIKTTDGLTIDGMTSEEWEEVQRRIDQADREAAALPVGPCPSWCIGPNHPDYKRWDASPDGLGGAMFSLFHESARDGYTYLDQFVERKSGNLTVHPVEITVTAESGAVIDAATAEKNAESLRAAARLLRRHDGSISALS